MSERWNLYLALDHQATPWPWTGRDFADLSAADVAVLPGAVDDLLRYSPTDGTTDRAHVPGSLPREAPVCRTELAVYHDAGHLYVFLSADKPAAPIPELADCPREDFSVVIPSGCAGRGFYFGMNEKAEHIGCALTWDADIPCDKADLPTPGGLDVAGPSGLRGSRLDGRYAARAFVTAKGLVGGFQIDRELAAIGMRAGSVRLSAGRVCYATGEWVSWGSPIVWSARDDLHGTAVLVEAARAPRQPTLARLDLVYDPDRESGLVEAHWRGTDSASLRPLQQGVYAGYADQVTVALNAREVTAPLAEVTRAAFAVPDGWNRLEVMTATNPVKEISFQKVSGHALRASPVPDSTMPGLSELREAFVRWHEAHERTYLGGGTWGEPGPRHCLCHAGIFHIEPYLVACRCLGRQPAYEKRIRETCERMLVEQKPEGWFPCHCSASQGEPQRGDGGAFTNGSVGEGLAFAADVLREPAWLAAAQRAADYSWYRWECNQNYAAFALWHLAALYERDREDRWLAQALYLARHAVIRDIGPGGAQGGHNFFTAYGNITLKGMARLLAVLPPDHEFRSPLSDKTIRFTNQILSRQQPSGLFAGRNRKYLGYHHPVPGLFFVAEAVPEQARALDSALAAMTRAILRGCEEDPKRRADSDSGLVLALAALAASRRASLRGSP